MTDSRSTGFRDAVCGGVGGAGRQGLSRAVAPGRPAATRRWWAGRVKGSELDRLMEVQTAAAPDFVWQLLDWTSRGDVVIVEWQTTRVINGARFDWRGVEQVPHPGRQGDRGAGLFGRHRAAARALRSGEALEPITRC